MSVRVVNSDSTLPVMLKQVVGNVIAVFLLCLPGRMALG